MYGRYVGVDGCFLEVQTMWFENGSPFFDVSTTLEEMGRIGAAMNAGVLTVRIAKPEEAKPKRIQITGS